MATKKGIVKKTPLADFANIRRTGVIAINLAGGDELRFVALTDGAKDIIIVTKEGMSIRFSEKNTRSMGRATSGVIGIRLNRTDEVISAEIAPPAAALLAVTEKGYGKQSKITDWPLQGRAGTGVKAAEITARNGLLVAAKVIEKNHEDLIITTREGQVIKLPIKEVPILTRQTQGVILIRLGNKEDRVAAATAITRERRGKVEKATAS